MFRRSTPNVFAAAVLVASACIGCRPDYLPEARTTLTEADYRIVEVPLMDVQSNSGVQASGGRWQLHPGVPVQVDGGPIVIEAENFESISWQPKVTRDGDDFQIFADQIEAKRQPLADPEASGGKAIDWVDAAVYSFNVTVPGNYTVYARHWRPSPGGWVYSHQVDQGDPERAWLRSEDTKAWRWEKYGTYTLTAGYHTFSIRNLHNGKRVDKFVFSPDANWTPEPDAVGPPATPMQALAGAQVTFRPVTLPGAESVQKLVLPKSVDAGAVVAEIAAGSGPFKPVPADGSLEGLALGKDKSVRVRLTLAASAEGAGPVLETPRLALRLRKPDYFIHGDDAIRLTVSRIDGSLMGLEDLHNDRAVLPVGRRVEPFTVTVKPSEGQPETVGFDNFTFTGGDARRGVLTLRYVDTARRIHVTLQIALKGGGLTEWTFNVTNLYRHDIVSFDFPRLDGVRLGDSADDDKLLWPAGTGKLYDSPISQGTVTAPYPRSAVGFFSLFDASGGLYVATHDPLLTSTRFAVSPNTTRTGFDITLTKNDRVKPGPQKRYTLAVGVHKGSWHTAADWYRAWYEAALGVPEWPDWVMHSDGWYFSNIHFKPYHYGELPESVFRQAIRWGLNHVQIWGTTPSSSCPTYYLPPDFVGGEKAMTEANGWFKDMGGRVGYYIHGNGINSYLTQSDTYYEKPWSDYPASVRPPSFQWYVENHGYPDRQTTITLEQKQKQWQRQLAQGRRRNKRHIPEDYSHMSNFSDPWHDWLTFWVAEKYCRQYNASTVYLDTFNGGAERPDYNPFLGLHGEGTGGHRRVKLIERIIKTARRTDPDFLPIMEMNTDAFGHRMAYMIGASAIDSEMLLYTHPNHIAFEGQTGSGQYGKKRFKRFNSAWLYGSRLDLHTVEPWSVEVLYMRKWLTLWLNRSRFADEIGLEVDRPEVRAKIRRYNAATSRGIVVTMWNQALMEWPHENPSTKAEHAEATVTIDLEKIAALDKGILSPEDWKPADEGENPGHVLLFSMGRDPERLAWELDEADGVKLRVKVPPRQLSALLIVARARDDSGIMMVARQKDFKQLDVKIVNPRHEPLNGAVAVEADGVEFKDGETVKTWMLGPGETTTVSFPYADPAALETIQHVKVHCQSRGYTRTVWASAYPVVDDKSFEKNAFGNYSTEHVAHGKRSLAAKGRATVATMLDGGKAYRLSCLVMMPKGTGGRLRYNVPNRHRAGDEGLLLSFDHPFKVTPGEWTKVSFTVRTPKWFIGERIDVIAGKTTEFYLDEFEVEVLPDDAKVDYQAKYHKP